MDSSSCIIITSSSSSSNGDDDEIIITENILQTYRYNRPGTCIVFCGKIWPLFINKNLINKL